MNTYFTTPVSKLRTIIRRVGPIEVLHQKPVTEKTKYLDEEETAQQSDTETDDEMDLDNYCLICDASMGPHNPRQLCGKTHCENHNSKFGFTCFFCRMCLKSCKVFLVCGFSPDDHAQHILTNMTTVDVSTLFGTSLPEGSWVDTQVNTAIDCEQCVDWCIQCEGHSKADLLLMLPNTNTKTSQFTDPKNFCKQLVLDKVIDDSENLRCSWCTMRSCCLKNFLSCKTCYNPLVPFGTLTKSQPTPVTICLECFFTHIKNDNSYDIFRSCTTCTERLSIILRDTFFQEPNPPYQFHIFTSGEFSKPNSF